VGAFPDGGAFVEKMTKAGFRDVSFSMLTFGIATLYFGVKK
jgi:ubiquinone/menaquinone biosynthesis C-methylase UbiE